MTPVTIPNRNQIPVAVTRPAEIDTPAINQHKPLTNPTQAAGRLEGSIGGAPGKASTSPPRIRVRPVTDAIPPATRQITPNENRVAGCT